MRINARSDETLGEMMLYLSQYNFKIIYAQGKDNIEADSLSRNPVLEYFGNEEDILRMVNCNTLKDIENDQKVHE